MPDSTLWKLPATRIFAAGTTRGQTWTEGDIDDMVSNARKFGDLIRPTLVIGHEEQQSLVSGMPATVEQNSGEPAFGTVNNLRKENADGGIFLVADLQDVPQWLAQLIAGKAYIDRSVEIYGEPPDGCEGAKGPILRRVALLGGELPQIKNLGQLPSPALQTYGERIIARARRPIHATAWRRTRDGGLLVTFSENKMATDSSTGLQTSGVGIVSAKSGQPVAGANYHGSTGINGRPIGGTFGVQYNPRTGRALDARSFSDDDTPPPVTRDQMLAMLVDLDPDFDPADAADMTDEQLADMICEKSGEQNLENHTFDPDEDTANRKVVERCFEFAERKTKNSQQPFKCAEGMRAFDAAKVRGRNKYSASEYLGIRGRKRR